MATIDPATPADTVTAQKSALRDNLKAIAGRIADVPDALDPGGNQATALLGRVCVIGQNSIVAAKSSGASPDYVDFGNAVVRAARADNVAITTNVTLSDAEHGGRALMVNSSSDVVVTADGGSISDGFVCVIRRIGTGEVAIATTGGLTLRHPDSHTRIYARYDAVEVTRYGSDLYLSGRTKS